MPPGGEVQPADGPVSPVGRHHPPGTPARPRGRRVQRGPRQHVGRGGRAAGGLVPALAPAPHARAAPAPRAARRPADQVGQDERTMRTSVTGPGMCTARWLLYYMYYAYLSYWTGHVYRTLACGCCHVMLWGVMTPHVPDELLFITIRNTF